MPRPQTDHSLSLRVCLSRELYYATRSLPPRVFQLLPMFSKRISTPDEKQASDTNNVPYISLLLASSANPCTARQLRKWEVDSSLPHNNPTMWGIPFKESNFIFKARTSWEQMQLNRGRTEIFMFIWCVCRRLQECEQEGHLLGGIQPKYLKRSIADIVSSVHTRIASIVGVSRRHRVGSVTSLLAWTGPKGLPLRWFSAVIKIMLVTHIS